MSNSNKVFIVIGVDENGEFFVIERNMPYSFNASYGYIFKQRKAAERLASVYKWASADVFSLQGQEFDFNDFDGHYAARKEAMRQFFPPKAA